MKPADRTRRRSEAWRCEAGRNEGGAAKPAEAKAAAPPVVVDAEGLEARLIEVASPGRQLRRPVDRREAPLLPVAPDRPRRHAGAQDAGDRQQAAAAGDVHRRSPVVRAVGRQQEDARQEGLDLLRGRRRGEGAGGSREAGGSAERLDVPPRPARRVAADVHRGVAPRARLLLRPRHARPRLADHPHEVPPAGRSRDGPRRAERHPRADGQRIVGAPHLRARRRHAARDRQRLAGGARRHADARREGGRVPRRSCLSAPIRIGPSGGRPCPDPASRSPRGT